MRKIVVFASGNGSNALNLIQYFNAGNFARVVAVFTNKKDAGVIQKALDNHVDVQIFKRHDFYESSVVIDMVDWYEPDLIVLAGFLWLVPEDFIMAFEDRIINIHPALLPKFGGKGMYGQNVHKAVLEAGEKETGISVHKVNRKFDEGEVIYRDKFIVEPEDDLISIEKKIHELEHRGLPKAIEQFFKK